MVSRTFYLALVSAIVAWLPVSQIQAKELAEYRIGDTVETDIIAPEKFLVVDPQATDALKRREGDRLPMVARFYPGIAGEAEASLRKTFIDARNNFLNLGETQFKHHLPDPNASDEFLQSVMDWPGLDKSFPLTPELTGLWARGQSDEAFLNALAAPLHVAMQQYIFPAQVPAGWHTGNAARLIALTNADSVPTPQLVDEKGFTVSRSNIVSFTKARTDFRAGFAPEDHVWANFVVQFLKENCAPDLKLTEAVRDSRTATIQMGDTYQAGQVVARRGDVVTAKTLAAIERVSDLRTAKAPQKPLETAVTLTPAVAVESNNHWLWFALGVVSLMAAAAIWKLRRRPSTSLVPSRFGSPKDGMETTVVGSRDFREMLAPHLARLMTNKLVRKLLAQRSDLIAMQKQVASEIEELERRLEQVHAPLQERLQTYEKRIAELEHQLAEQAEQNRELIKAKIEAVKQQMESERAKNRLKFN